MAVTLAARPGATLARLVVVDQVTLIRSRLVATIAIRCEDCGAQLVTTTMMQRRVPGLVRALRRVHRCDS